MVISIIDVGSGWVSKLSARLPSSLRRYLHRHVDPARCGFPQRMCFQIDLREQRHVGGADRISKRFLIATFQVGGGLQIDPVAMRADYPGSLLEAAIELLRPGRLS